MISNAALRQLPWLFFSFRGRISTAEFRLGAALAVLLFLIIGLTLGQLLDAVIEYSWSTRLVRRLIPRAFLVVAAYMLSALCAKRSHDLGEPGTWVHLIWASAAAALIFYILASFLAPDLRHYSQLPALVVLFVLRRKRIRRLVAVEGEARENEHGPPPPQV